MLEKHKNFDSKKLFDRKEKYSGYKFCPYCSNKLIAGEYDGTIRPACISDNCDFIFYQNPVPAAGAIIVEDNKILLVQRAHPPKIGDWCVPAGFMEWNEHPTQTAIREIAEETGLDIKIDSFFEVYSGKDDPRNNAVLILYLAQYIGGSLKAMDDALDVKFFGFDEIPSNIAFESHIQAIADYRDRYLSE